MTTPSNHPRVSRRVREAVARGKLAALLDWVFDPALLAQADEDLKRFVYAMQGQLLEVVPVWNPDTRHHYGESMAGIRKELSAAFAKIRALARDVANGEPGGVFPMQVELYVAGAAFDREGRMTWALDGRLVDQVIWIGVTLLATVPRGLIRSCGFHQCPRIYVGGKNQRYCVNHQAEAHRQTQRRAERAFHERLRLAGGRIRTVSKRTKLVTKRRRGTKS